MVSAAPQACSAQPKCAWVVDGLAARLREAFLAKHLGRNEATYR